MRLRAVRVKSVMMNPLGFLLFYNNGFCDGFRLRQAGSAIFPSPRATRLPGPKSERNHAGYSQLPYDAIAKFLRTDHPSVPGLPAIARYAHRYGSRHAAPARLRTHASASAAWTLYWLPCGWLNESARYSQSHRHPGYCLRARDDPAATTNARYSRS